jgi:hypothetical protein
VCWDDFKVYFVTEKLKMKDLFHLIARQIIPQEILNSFDVVSLDDSKEEELIISLVEKETLVPESDQLLVFNGFLKEIELSHFPSNGRQCFLRLKRRRWKAKGTSGGRSFYNSYDYTIEGTKVTKEFGAFLKEIGSKTSF